MRGSSITVNNTTYLEIFSLLRSQVDRHRNSFSVLLEAIFPEKHKTFIKDWNVPSKQQIEAQ